MAVRMKDIARDLGVSVVTVSKVLRNHSDISEETRQRVLKRMKELHYRPNLAARALITGKTFTIGLIVPDLLHPFFAQVAKALSGVFRQRGYSLILSSSEEDPELEKQELDVLLARRVDAILIASAQWTVESFRQIEDQKIPYVLIDRQFAGLAANFVGVDDEAAGALATEHLIEQGCHRIAHIRGPEVSTAIGRAEGYRRSLARHGRTPQPGYVISMGASGDARGEAGGYEAARTLLAMEPRPDGIFCYNDPAAMGVMHAILDAGLRIPEDIAVVGCGNVHYSDFLRVPLTTIDQNSQAIGERAAELALALIDAKGSMRPSSICVTPALAVRASSRRKG
ncbi:MAG: LacI family DNA-binding transcriptional regulator [Bryobacteraceae bacterium]|nr:LacI family DNA-binding transcriptional regulator [Bryobacteraceae bacterium]